MSERIEMKDTVISVYTNDDKKAKKDHKFPQVTEFYISESPKFMTINIVFKELGARYQFKMPKEV